ncbi:hypothetical protein NEUTE1DRAFT_125930 [Neurospora tetrasperma FGSC 2508]|uniref:Uncharacterized protein n=1 Tax=Neurospora tetrasperma (strain FGSC 2508 / ATCC MYA-4615 / P0657) TaxID=510951 RepID=F8N262_NEUT8|nr:uncharacterized protein NEUTE1DRAFT_125930 [Neurospora tetrasperma FGSC 2508]EGO52436.1 hypothetical protein NEUTE1DRAFT_125930 [Neurospora tetrasperma FGSC 2508]
MAPKSRRSVHSSTPIPMPVIVEDENAANPRHEATTEPTIPPRSPQRRSMSFTRSNGVLSTNSSLYAPSTRPAMYRSTSVPQYVPKRVPGIRAVGGEVGSVRSISLNSNGTVEWVVPMRDRDREGWTSDGSPAQPVKGKTEDRIKREQGGKKEDTALGEWVRRRETLIRKLSARHHSSEPGPPLPTDLFPAGSYTFTAALTNLSTSCAPKRNPALWRCYPYSIYSPSANESISAASFRWIIRPTTTFSYVISSSDDPFSPTGIFRDVSLTMIDANQPSERFTFGFTMAKAVVPDVSTTSGSSSSLSSTVSSMISTTSITVDVLSSSASASQAASNGREEGNGTPSKRRWLRTAKRANDNTISREIPTPAPAICWYNQTAVRGTIWTRMRASYPAKISDVSTPLINATNVFALWPFAVELTFEQTYEEDESDKGKKAPDCRDAQGKPVVFGNNDNVKAVGERGVPVIRRAESCG